MEDREKGERGRERVKGGKEEYRKRVTKTGKDERERDRQREEERRRI